MLSELDVMCICELKFLSKVLSPGGVDFDLVCEQGGSKERVPEVRSSNRSSFVESFHSALTSFDVLSVKLQLLVNWVYCSGVCLHVENSEEPDYNETGDHRLRHSGEVLDKSPIGIARRIFDESEEVFEASLFVGSVDALLAESVFFELPIVLLSDRSK